MTCPTEAVHHSHRFHPGGTRVSTSGQKKQLLETPSTGKTRIKSKNKKQKNKREFLFIFNTNHRITKRPHEESQLSVKGLSVVRPFRFRGHQPQEAPGRMFIYHSLSQWQRIIHLPVELIMDNVSVSIALFLSVIPFAQSVEVLQTRMYPHQESQRKVCLLEPKV